MQGQNCATEQEPRVAEEPSEEKQLAHVETPSIEESSTVQSAAHELNQLKTEVATLPPATAFKYVPLASQVDLGMPFVDSLIDRQKNLITERNFSVSADYRWPEVRLGRIEANGVAHITFTQEIKWPLDIIQ